MPLDDFIIYVYCYVADIFPQVVDVLSLSWRIAGNGRRVLVKISIVGANSHWQCAMIGSSGQRKAGRRSCRSLFTTNQYSTPSQLWSNYQWKSRPCSTNVDTLWANKDEEAWMKLAESGASNDSAVSEWGGLYLTIAKCSGRGNMSRPAVR